jgi:hypothetical protein
MDADPAAESKERRWSVLRSTEGEGETHTRLPPCLVTCGGQATMNPMMVIT